LPPYNLLDDYKRLGETLSPTVHIEDGANMFLRNADNHTTRTT
jgi:hypothetical protein